jgi:AcrR family transcriptional regulator
MVVSRQESGRTNQKLRTRRAIIDSAAELVRENRTPTVAEAAERALVSRATAYRYFPSQQSLLIELQADASQPSPDAVLAEVGGDVEARVEAITRALARMILDDEAFFRNQIRVIQELWFAARGDPSVPVREGRRLLFIDKALEPVVGQLSADSQQRLREALAVVVGVEAVISLRDVCGLGPQATEDVLAWTATSIVRAAMSGAPRRQ